MGPKLGIISIKTSLRYKLQQFCKHKPIKREYHKVVVVRSNCLERKPIDCGIGATLFAAALYGQENIFQNLFKLHGILF